MFTRWVPRRRPLSYGSSDKVSDGTGSYFPRSSSTRCVRQPAELHRVQAPQAVSAGASTGATCRLVAAEREWVADETQYSAASGEDTHSSILIRFWRQSEMSTHGVTGTGQASGVIQVSWAVRTGPRPSKSPASNANVECGHWSVDSRSVGVGGPFDTMVPRFRAGATISRMSPVATVTLCATQIHVPHTDSV